MKDQKRRHRGAPIAKPSEVYVRELSPEELHVLQELYHRTPDARIKTRCQIILLSAKPMSVPQIAQVIFYSEDTVARCIHEFNQSRLDSLLPEAKGGRPPKITPEYLKRLLSIIEQDPRALGCPFSSWTAPLLAEYLAAQTGLRLDESRIRHYLHAHDYELLRPVLTVASPDPEYENKRVRIQDLQRQAEAGEIDLYYEDEIDLALLPTITRCWCQRGHQRKIQTPRKNQKRYGAGLIHWVSGKLYWATSDHKDNALFRSVLSQVLEPPEVGAVRKKYIVIDNYRIHFAKPVLALLAAYSDQIELVTLPTYSPQLNPVERFWKHLRRKVTHNTFFQTIDRLLDAVTGFLRDMAACPQIVRSVAGLAA
jgi:putative transposase